MKTTKVISLLLMMVICYCATAQNSASNPNRTSSRPSIMVFPFFKEGEDARKIIESDVNQRIILAKIREAFDSRGYTTKDYLPVVRSLLTNGVLNDAQVDVKTQIIAASGADVSVEAEYYVQKISLGTSVRLILTAYESSTSASLANKVGQSPAFRTEDIGALAARSVEAVSTDFLNVMQQKFDDIAVNGRYMSVEFGLTADTEANMETEVGKEGLTLSDAIEEWIGNNSNSYHILGVTEKKAIYDQVRLPKTNKAGKNLTTTMYGLELLRFCKTLVSDELPGKKFTVTRFNKGNTLFVNFK
jgi:hypothetical protein